MEKKPSYYTYFSIEFGKKNFQDEEIDVKKVENMRKFSSSSNVTNMCSPQRLIFEVDWLPKIENCSNFRSKKIHGGYLCTYLISQKTVIKNKIYRIQFLFFSILA